MWWTSSWLGGLWDIFSQTHSGLWDFMGSIWGWVGQWFAGFSALSPLFQLFIIAAILGCGVWVAIHHDQENYLGSRFLRILRGIAVTFSGPPIMGVAIVLGVEFMLAIFFYAVWMSVWLFALVLAVYSYLGEALLRAIGLVR